MKILYYLLVVATLPFFVACQKGVARESILYANVSFGNRTGVTLQITADDMPAKAFGIEGLGLPLTAGLHRLRFAEGDKQLLDTTLTIPLSAKIPAVEYAVFRPDPSAALQLWSFDLLGMNNVAAPPKGYCTMSIINTATQLPDTVDVHFYANAWVDGQDREVEAGVIKGVTRKGFSPFVQLFIGRGRLDGQFSEAYRILVTRQGTDEVLQSSNYMINLGYANPPAHYIYTAYFTNSKLTTLLEK